MFSRVILFFLFISTSYAEVGDTCFTDDDQLGLIDNSESCVISPVPNPCDDKFLCHPYLFGKTQDDNFICVEENTFRSCRQASIDFESISRQRKEEENGQYENLFQTAQLNCRLDNDQNSCQFLDFIQDYNLLINPSSVDGISDLEESAADIAEYLNPSNLDTSLGEILSADELDSPETRLDEETEPLTQEPSACEQSIANYFSDEIEQSTLEKFLSLQAELTLHRLAWANLKMMNFNDETQHKKKLLEENIIHLLRQKFEETDDSKFKAALEEFESRPLSRSALVIVMPFVSEIIQEQSNPDEVFYHLSSSDIKMLDILSLKESRDDAKASLFLQNKSKDQSILHLTKIINSSYRDVDLAMPETFQKNLAVIDEKIKSILLELDSFVQGLIALPSCREDESMTLFCDSEIFDPASRVNAILEMELIATAIKDSIVQSDKDIYSKLRFGDQWLRVKR